MDIHQTTSGDIQHTRRVDDLLLHLPKGAPNSFVLAAKVPYVDHAYKYNKVCLFCYPCAHTARPLPAPHFTATKSTLYSLCV